jgi:hypothetical protein
MALELKGALGSGIEMALEVKGALGSGLSHCFFSTLEVFHCLRPRRPRGDRSRLHRGPRPCFFSVIVPCIGRTRVGGLYKP